MMRQIKSKHLSCNYEAITAETEILNIRDFVESIINKILQIVSNIVSSLHHHIWFLKPIWPTRQFKEGFWLVNNMWWNPIPLNIVLELITKNEHTWVNTPFLTWLHFRTLTQVIRFDMENGIRCITLNDEDDLIILTIGLVLQTYH